MTIRSISQIFIFASLALVATAPAHAGQGHGKHRGHNIEHRIERMSASMDLSEAQALQIRNILSEQRTAMAALRADESLTRDERRTQMRSLRASARQDVDAVLTAEQREARKAHHQAKAQQRKGQRIESLRIILELDEKQVAAMTALHDKAADERKAALEAAGGDHKAARAAMKAQRESMRAAFDALLNEEQRAKMDALQAMKRGQRHGRRGRKGRGGGGHGQKHGQH